MSLHHISIHVGERPPLLLCWSKAAGFFPLGFTFPSTMQRMRINVEHVSSLAHDDLTGPEQPINPEPEKV